MFKKCREVQKIAWYQNESIRFDVDSIAIRK